MSMHQPYLPEEERTVHTHSYAQIIIPYQEILRLYIQKKLYAIMSKELCLVPPNVPHQCLNDCPVLLIKIPEITFHQMDKGLMKQRQVFAANADTSALIDLIWRETQANPGSNGLRYLHYYLYDKLIAAKSSPSLQYIHTHFDEPLQVAKLAQIENYNITYFNKWFKKQTNCTPAQYIRLLRIDAAKDLLANTDFTIVDIAIQTGYTSHSAFTRAFKEAVGCSPQEYREKERKHVMNSGVIK